jgi:hypothetical protein
MTVNLTGPHNCAECGTGITLETALDGDSGHLVITIRGHKVEIPGLYVCTPCAGAIMAGERESGVTWEAARDFLAGVYRPLLTAHLLLGEPGPDMLLATIARLNDVMEVKFLLDACIELRDEPGGLDFIPECNGKHERGHPRDMAAMN